MQFLRYLLTFCAVALLAPTAAEAKLRVTATVPDLAAVARDVGGDLVKVSALVQPSQDPHFVDAKPSLALELSRSDLLLLVGLDLEVGWLPTLVTGARNPKILPGATGYLDCSTLVEVLGAPPPGADRSEGDLHPGGNPHYLYDPRAMVNVVWGIAARLGDLDPANRDAYFAGAGALVNRLAERRAVWEARLAPLRGAPIVTYHRSWIYLQDWLGFEIAGEIEPKPGIPPGPAHVSRLVRLCEERKPLLILQEAYYPESTARMIAERTGLPLVKAPPAANLKAGEGYVEHLERLVDALSAALEVADAQ